MKYLYIALAVLFLIFTTVQINDETGSLTWMAGYISISALFGLAATGRYFRALTALAILGVLAGLVYFTPGFGAFLTNNDGIGFGQTMSNEYPYIEEMREWGGLMISLIALSYLFWQIEKQESKKTASNE